MGQPQPRRRYLAAHRNGLLIEQAEAAENLAPAEPTQLELENVHSLEDLLKRLKIKEWDFVLVGDGSGNTWKTAIGYASVLIERATFQRTLWYGGMSRGTNNTAEMMACLAPLLFLSATHRERTFGQKIHIISDSQYIVNGINGVNLQKGNYELWQAIRATRHSGLALKAHWIPRAEVGLNKVADAVAGDLRRLMLAITTEQSLDSVNPTEE